MIRSYQGKLPQIPASCYIDASAQLLGDVVLGERSSVWMNAVLRGDVNSIRVATAPTCRIAPCCTASATFTR
jgi:carbonic anhydrase/acetyltransferase-like protein (isoleucine patch superfamily)